MNTEQKLNCMAQRIDVLNWKIAEMEKDGKAGIGARRERRALQWALSSLVEALSVSDPNIVARAKRFEQERLERKAACREAARTAGIYGVEL